MTALFDFSLLSAQTAAWSMVLLDASMKGLVVLAIAAVLALSLRRASAASRHLIWSLALSSLIALPILSLALPSWHVPILRRVLPATLTEQQGIQPESALAGGSSAPEQVVQPEHLASTLQSLHDVDRTASVSASSQERPRQANVISPIPLHWSVWILLTWAAGALVSITPLLVGALCVWRMGRRARAITNTSWAALLCQLTDGMNLSRRVRLLQSDKAAMPMTWGLLRPVVVLPADADTWSSERRRAVLVHELSHVLRWDYLTQTLARIACAIYWLNPLVWLAVHRLRVERERACDDIVLNAGSKASEYADHLLDIARSLRSGACPSDVAQSASLRSMEIAAVAMARASRLEGRLRAILDGKRNRRALTRLVVILALAAVASVVLPLAAVRPAAKAEEATEEDISVTETDDVQPASEWTAKLPNGVTVELVGVTYNGSTIRYFTDKPLDEFSGCPRWKPDGSPLPAALYWTGSDSSMEMFAYEFAIRVSGADSFSCTAFGPPDKSAGEVRIALAKERKPAPSLRSFVVSRFKRREIEATIRIGLATESWQRVQRYDGYFGEGQYGVMHNDDVGVILTWPRQKDNAVIAEVSHTYVHDATRLIAFDRKGRVLETVGLDGGKGAGLARRIYRFEGLKLRDIQRFEFQRRPYNHWITFENVSLKPGHQTDVRIKTEQVADKVERAEEATKAKAQAPSSASRSFGPVIERIVNDDGVGKDMLVDFDTGKLFTPPPNLKSGRDGDAVPAWIQKNGIDAMGETGLRARGLMGFEMIAIPVGNENWEKEPFDFIVEQLSFGKPGTPAVMSGKGELPVTFLIKTREGGMGIMQILDVNTRVARGISIRYKMLQPASKAPPMKERSGQSPAKMKRESGKTSGKPTKQTRPRPARETPSGGRKKSYSPGADPSAPSGRAKEQSANDQNQPVRKLAEGVENRDSQTPKRTAEKENGKQRPQGGKLLTVAGTCFDNEKGPIAGAEVSLYEQDYRSDSLRLLGNCHTDQGGKLRFDGLPFIGEESWGQRFYFVVARAEGRGTAFATIRSRSVRADALKLMMTKPAAIHGSLVGPRGEAVSDATIQVRIWRFSKEIKKAQEYSSVYPLAPIEGLSATSDADGRFEISDLPTGAEGRLVIQHPDFAEKWSPFKTPDTVNVHVSLENEGVIEGHALYDDTGKPAVGVVVEAQGTKKGQFARTMTDDNGRYRLESLRADRYNVWVEKEGWTMHALDSLRTVSGQTTVAPDIRLVRGGFISGVVLDAATGIPVKPGPGSDVGLYGPSRPKSGAAIESIPVQPDGAFRIRVAPGNNYVYLRPRSPWTAEATREHGVEVRDGETVEVQFKARRLKEGEKIRLPLKVLVGGKMLRRDIIHYPNPPQEFLDELARLYEEGMKGHEEGDHAAALKKLEACLNKCKSFKTQWPNDSHTAAVMDIATDIEKVLKKMKNKRLERPPAKQKHEPIP